MSAFVRDFLQNNKQEIKFIFKIKEKYMLGLELNCFTGNI